MDDCTKGDRDVVIYSKAASFSNSSSCSNQRIPLLISSPSFVIIPVYFFFSVLLHISRLVFYPSFLYLRYIHFLIHLLILGIILC